VHGRRLRRPCPCRRRGRGRSSLELDLRRRRAVPSEEPSGCRTGGEDEHREDHRPAPAPPWCRDRRRRRGDPRTGSWSRPLAGCGQELPRPLGERGVDQRELGTDRSELRVAGRDRSERSFGHRRVDVWAFVHRDSLTRLHGSCDERRSSLSCGKARASRRSLLYEICALCREFGTATSVVERSRPPNQVKERRQRPEPGPAGVWVRIRARRICDLPLHLPRSNEPLSSP
jgi:hypothetical protein